MLADDMGLGKTLSTLVFLREWLNGWEAEKGQKAPACLIVCPLSLVENWQEEITKSYAPELNPFSRVVGSVKFLL
jgi:SNF2 family DNA or RNA helicase